MIFRKFFIFATFACAFGLSGNLLQGMSARYRYDLDPGYEDFLADQRARITRYISWSEASLCVYEIDDNKLVAKLSDAATLRQNDVFAWIREQGVSVGTESRAFEIWVEHAYKHASNCSWRWEWPNLFLATEAGFSFTCVEGLWSCFFGRLHSYCPCLTINVESLTIEQLREKLRGFLTPDIDVPHFDGAPAVIGEIVRVGIDQILGEFLNQKR